MSFRRVVGVIRRTPGHMSESGYYVQGEEVPGQILASVQPLSVSEQSEYINANSNGEYTVNFIKIYSTTPLRPGRQEDCSTGQDGDFVLWRGKRYRIIMCREYQMDVISHFKMVAVEINTEVHDDSENLPA